MKSIRTRTTLGHRVISAFLAATMVFMGSVPPVAIAGGGPIVASVAVQNSYDGNGNLVQRVDGNGATTAFTYDTINRLVAIDYPGGASPDVRFTYDRNGNRTRMTDWTGTTSYEYDMFDRLTGIDYPDGGFVMYEYDDAGNVTDLKYGNYSALLLQGVYTYIQYGYDPDNRLTSVRNIFTSHETTYAYDAAGSVTRRSLPNGAYTDYGYDADGRLTNVVHLKSDNTLICGYGYTLNAIGNRTRVVETTPSGTKTTAYTYDPLDRLDTVTYPDGRFVNYDYDSFGNRTNMVEVIGTTNNRTAYLYDADSRLLSTTRNGASEEMFIYDSAGNLIQRFRVTDRRLINYLYDAENRLVRHYDGTNNVEYVYNGTGGRVGKIVNGERMNYINDPNRTCVQVLVETDSSGTAQRVYEWGNELINQEDIYGAARNYYLHDALMGSVCRLVNSNAVVVNSYEYDAFGKPTTKVEAVANDYQFHGEVQEEETELVYLRARYVTPELGRFFGRDPDPGQLDHPSTLNPYAFVGSDPINARDPLGTVVWWVPGAAGALWGTATYWGSSAVTGERITLAGTAGAATAGAVGAYTRIGRIGGAVASFGSSYFFQNKGFGSSLVSGASAYVFSGTSVNWVNTRTAFGAFFSKPATRFANQQIAGGILSTYADSIYSGLRSSLNSNLGRPGGIALNKSANVLLNINDIRGATFDAATGQILLYGSSNAAPTALPPMSLDDLAVAFKAVNQGTMPVVSIEDPVVPSPPEWPGRDCFTVRYGPFYTDPVDGVSKVLDASSKTHFGWVMFDADRQMKCLGMGKDNRTGAPVSSAVPGYRNWVDLALTYWNGSGQFQTRFWFNPKEIVIQPSPDGKSMELKKAEMQLSTECMFSSSGQVESTPDAEYYANWFTVNYDAIAQEQTTRDNTNGVHYIFKELKQLAAMVGVVKWVQENNIPMDLSFLQNYTPEYYGSAPSYTPRTTTSGSRSSGGWQYTVTIQGGVNYCKDLDFGTGGNPTGLAAAALTNRVSETNLAWTFKQGSTNYNVTALSVDRTEKDGGFSHAAVDASLKVSGAMLLTVARFFDSFSVGPTMFGWGWQTQPYALEFKGSRTKFNLCAQYWEGYGEVWFSSRAEQRHYKFVPSGIYNRTSDVLGIASRFAPNQDILAYSYETKDTPGKLFSDNKTGLVMRLADGVLLDFDLDGRLLRVEDRNGNAVQYSYDAGRRLTSVGQPGGRAIAFNYDTQNRATGATLPDGHSVAYSYDGLGNLVSAQYDADRGGRILRYSYDADHALTELRDESGDAVESRSYDVYGRVQSTTQPGVAAPLANQFNLAQRQTRVSGPAGLSQTMEYDQNHDPVRITDARTNTTVLAYNRYRDVITETDAEGRVVQHFYDYRGNRIASVRPNGRADVTLLDINNNPITTFHANGGTNFSSRFDSEHVLVAGGLPYYTVNNTDYDYDVRGNLTAIADANFHTNTFAYDGQGNLVLARDARGFARGFTYDGFSRLSSMTNPLGHRIDCSYDDRDNLSRVATRAGTVDSTYNAKNQLQNVTKGDVGTRRTTSYTYNARGQILTVTDPAGALTEYTYDVRGNLTQIRHGGIVRFTYEYDGLNRLVATRYNGTTGGGQAAIIPLGPVGRETFTGIIPINWRQRGDWGNLTNVTLQYTLDGSNWITIATVPSASGSYAWNPGTLISDSVRLRFLDSGTSPSIIAETAEFRVLRGGSYFVNDYETTGDNYCHAAGRSYNGTTVTGQTPSDPVAELQDIFNNYTLKPGDVVYVDSGAYVLFSDLTITPAAQGAPSKPVTVAGPTNGTALFLHLNPSASDACVFVDGARNITIEGLAFSGSRNGIWLYNAFDCAVRNNICTENGVDGGLGEYGYGSGIRVSGGGGHVISGNVCSNNGANGGNSRAVAGSGGPGRGFGIVIESSVNNTVRSNICFRNGGIGGLPGSSLAKPGDSEGFGIRIQSLGNIAEGNQVLDNICYENQGLAFDVVTPTNPCAGGVGRGCGISLIQTRNTTVERNIVYANAGRGGSSWNGSDGNSGGDGYGFGIYAQDDRGLLVTKNTSHANLGYGERGGHDAPDRIGTGQGSGIMLVRCPDSVVKNNLCFENLGVTYGTFGSESNGMAYASGIRVSSSANCLVANNTLVGNHGEVFTNGTAMAVTTMAQIHLDGASTNCDLRNNICDTGGFECATLWIESLSTSGLASDFNDLYVHGQGVTGVWGTTHCQDAQAWLALSMQDRHSITNAPGYYDEGGQNYHLGANSPAIDAGEGLAAMQEDCDSEPRPSDGPDSDLVKTQDIGFDEFVDTDSDGLSDQTENAVTHTNPVEADSDFDGLPDGWEVRYGLDAMGALGSNGASGDPDGDGYDNLQEYLAGSQPKVAALMPVPPVITQFAPAGSSLWLLEEDDVVFSASATDANNDEISCRWLLEGVEQTKGPTWRFATTSDSSGSLTLSREYLIDLRVRADGDEVSRQWVAIVHNRNHAPVLSIMSNVIARVGDIITLNPVYLDPDNTNGVSGDDNRLEVSYSGWMTNAMRAVRSTDQGLHYVTVTVRDDGSPPLSAQQTIQVAVEVPPLSFGPILNLGDGSFRLTLSGVASRNCALEFSHDLQNWTSVTNFLLTNDVLEFTLPIRTNIVGGFYRAKQQ